MNDLSQGILAGLSGVAGGLSKRFDIQEAQRKKELEDFQKQQLLRNLLLSFQSYQPQQLTPEQKAAGEVGGVQAIPFGRPIGAPETVDAISRATADPAVLNQFLSLRSLGQPTYDIQNQEGGGYDIFKKVPGQVPERVGGKEGTTKPAGGYAPTETAKLLEEYNAIKAQDPQDPRLAQYEAELKRRREGVPYFQQMPTANGEIKTFNPRTGAVGGTTGEFKQAPAEIRSAKVNLRDNLASVRLVRDAYDKTLVGPAAGNVGKAVQMFRNSPEFSTLRARLGRLRTIIYGLSGKQINEAEQEWLNKEILPRLTNPDQNFSIYLNEYEQWVNQKLALLDEEFPTGEKPKPEKVDKDPLGILR